MNVSSTTWDLTTFSLWYLWNHNFILCCQTFLLFEQGRSHAVTKIKFNSFSDFNFFASFFLFFQLFSSFDPHCYCGLCFISFPPVLRYISLLLLTLLLLLLILNLILFLLILNLLLILLLLFILILIVIVLSLIESSSQLKHTISPPVTYIVQTTATSGYVKYW